ncbi:LacI family transcriptional regulator [Xylanibacillus composti]|uniref:LacI family transcriptional regulator n=1 Tax=Xylanibacillus composti TaxID=1572762 RepID=A0A8J4H520_9BACL|nr:LacI family DNA-binding transcriptional regulator [Xylanibacillus composti]MDT9726027.1 LacI family transcriptional regulator [Xylanibacillus composti]GIQ68828.1 LacI family transcriptional regulator [Xylanibacillus composti]
MGKNIREIAELAGVSIATVSKVINGYTSVSAKTREKVMQIVNDTGFMPNSAARELVKKRSMTLGIFLTTGLTHPFFHQLLGGIEVALKEKGFDLIYLAQLGWTEEYSFVRHLRSRNVEGVLVFGFQRRDLNFDELIQSEIPTIFIDLDLTGPRSGYITSENKHSIKRAVEYLYSLNHRKIAFITGTLESFAGRLRFEAYRQAISDLGLPYVAEFVAAGNWEKPSGYSGTKRFLALQDRPTAIICSSDMSAIGAMEAVMDAGLSVPDDISVIGFDDIELTQHLRPALTTIRQNTFQIGKQAVELLVEMINNPDSPPPAVAIPTELIIRDSCTVHRE